MLKYTSDTVEKITGWELENEVIIGEPDREWVGQGNMIWAAHVKGIDAFVIGCDNKTILIKNSDVRHLEHFLQSIPS